MSWLQMQLGHLRALLIADVSQCWKLLSVQVHLAAAAYVSLYTLMPALDPSIAKLLPTPFQTTAYGIYIALGIAARLINQKKPGA